MWLIGNDLENTFSWTIWYGECYALIWRRTYNRWWKRSRDCWCDNLIVYLRVCCHMKKKSSKEENILAELSLDVHSNTEYSRVCVKNILVREEYSSIGLLPSIGVLLQKGVFGGIFVFLLRRRRWNILLRRIKRCHDMNTYLEWRWWVCERGRRRARDESTSKVSHWAVGRMEHLSGTNNNTIRHEETSQR